jgi:hypothetical protein
MALKHSTAQLIAQAKHIIMCPAVIAVIIIIGDITKLP